MNGIEWNDWMLWLNDWVWFNFVWFKIVFVVVVVVVIGCMVE